MDRAKSLQVLTGIYVRLYVAFKDDLIVYVSKGHFFPKFELCPLMRNQY